MASLSTISPFLLFLEAFVSVVFSLSPFDPLPTWSFHSPLTGDAANNPDAYSIDLVPGITPGSRRGATIFRSPSHVYLFGGESSEEGSSIYATTNDMWRMDVDSREPKDWEAISLSGDVPSERGSTYVFPLCSSNRSESSTHFVLFGGHPSWSVVESQDVFIFNSFDDSFDELYTTPGVIPAEEPNAEKRMVWCVDGLLYVTGRVPSAFDTPMWTFDLESPAGLWGKRPTHVSPIPSSVNVVPSHWSSGNSTHTRLWFHLFPSGASNSPCFDWYWDVSEDIDYVRWVAFGEGFAAGPGYELCRRGSAGSIHHGGDYGVIYGGYGYLGYWGDLWLLDLTSSSFQPDYYRLPISETFETQILSQHTSSPLYPGARRYHGSYVSTTSSSLIFHIFGGDSHSGTFRMDLWSIEIPICRNGGTCNAAIAGCVECVCDPLRGAGRRCERLVCGDFEEGEVGVCGGHGSCSTNADGTSNACDCDDGFILNSNGMNCEVANFFTSIEFFVSVISASAVAILLLIVIVFVIILLCVFTQKRQRSKGNSVDSVENELEASELAEADSVIARLRQHPDLFRISYQEVKLTKKIGKGAGGTVFVGTWNGVKIAFKSFQTTMLSDDADYDDFIRELNLFSSLKHPNVVQCFGGTFASNRVGIVMEFCSRGDVERWITETPNAGTDLIDETSILSGTAQAMRFLHSKRILHRDLKIQNVLLDDSSSSLIPKCIDFGVSRLISDREGEALTRRVGTAFGMAPEVTQGGSYDSKADVFSYGIFLFQVCFRELKPYRMQQDEQAGDFLIEMKVANDPSFRPHTANARGVRPELVALMKKCWSHDPSMRPDFGMIVERLEHGC